MRVLSAPRSGPARPAPRGGSSKVAKPHLLASHVLTGAALCAALAASHATTIDLASGTWSAFNVSDIDSQSHGVEWIDNANSLDPAFGSALSFNFTIAAGSKGLLTVVDAGFAGDSFTLGNFGQTLGTTSSVPATTDATAAYVGTDFDAALADPSFSRKQIELGAGSYSISGSLLQSVSSDFDGTPLNATVGGVMLAVSPVPEPTSWAMLLAGLGTVVFVARRRNR